MPISDADRAFLSVDWRWAEASDAAVKTRHPGAREADYGSAFVTVAGATLALNIISSLTDGKKRVINCRVSGIIPVTFKSRPRTVRLHHARFGGDAVNGKLMMVQSATVDYASNSTSLSLIG